MKLTPKEKSNNLIELFKKDVVGSISSELVNAFDEEYPNFEGSRKWSALWKFAKLWRAKQCALKCVDEILGSWYVIIPTNMVENQIKYWKEVKKEINNYRED